MSASVTSRNVTSGTAGGGAYAAIAAVFRHQLRRTRSAWVSSLAAGLANPTITLLALGLGLGTQIDDADIARLGVDSYLDFLGPGLLMVSAMQISANEAMWPTMGLLRWQGVYKAVLATPITSAELGIGHTLWIAFRGMVASTCFLVVLAIAGALNSWLALLIPLLALLFAFVHAAPLVAFTVGLEQENVFPMISRIVIFPLFLFSGAFFPLDEVPAAVAVVARVIPTWHGVELARHLSAGDVSSVDGLHLAYLLVVGVVGLLLVRRQFRKHLEL